MDNYFILFSNCMPVAGLKNAIICDLQNGVYLPIPNLLFEVLSVNRKNKFSVEALKKYYENKLDSGIDAYIRYLIEKGFGAVVESPDNFPDLSMKWDFPGQISNAIIEVSPDIEMAIYADLFNQLTELGCFALEMRIYERTGIEKLTKIIEYTDQSSLRYILLLVTYDENIDPETYELLMKEHPRVAYIAVFYTPEAGAVNLDKVRFLNEKLDRRQCGLIGKDYFTMNIRFFSEAIQHNSCLNRKIAVDADGNIKNCPSMAPSFGNIKNTKLQDALDQPEFKQYWHMSKDQINICRNCEFRYICTDCRAYLENPEEKNAKPLKCGYDPSTGEWEEWSTHPLKQQAMDYYGMREVQH